jgi:hypothetical protein
MASVSSANKKLTVRSDDFRFARQSPAIQKVNQRRERCRKSLTRMYQSLCLPAGVPSDQSATTTKNTRIGGSPFIWDGSFDEKNQ